MKNNKEWWLVHSEAFLKIEDLPIKINKQFCNSLVPFIRTFVKSTLEK
jgi:hypothetical protein